MIRFKSNHKWRHTHRREMLNTKCQQDIVEGGVYFWNVIYETSLIALKNLTNREFNKRPLLYNELYFNCISTQSLRIFDAFYILKQICFMYDLWLVFLGSISQIFNGIWKKAEMLQSLWLVLNVFFPLLTKMLLIRRSKQYLRKIL